MSSFVNKIVKDLKENPEQFKLERKMSEEREKDDIPFVGLHAHSAASVYDGLGYPDEHMNYAYSNGSDALALTDHGNMNGLPYQVLHAKKMAKEGKDFKPIYGVEAYFHPSISTWEEDKIRIDEEKSLAKKKGKKDTGTEVSAATVEDESASKKDIKNILNKRRHMILLAQNQVGLQNIFKMISQSYQTPNFYRFPRIDYAMLREHSEGVIAASACLGGVYAGDFWENREEGDEAVLAAMRNTSKNMVDIFGDRWYGELQWNGIEEQHILNQHIIKVCGEFDIPLISTADSHYPNPDAWKDRILYKRLAWAGNKDSDTVLPETVEETKCELYPKNGTQMWESYKRYSSDAGVEYNDELVLESIKRTAEIAYERIESFFPDNQVRLPSFVVPKGTTAEDELTKLSNEGLREIKRRLKLSGSKWKEYEERLALELNIINSNGFASYFLTMKALVDRGNEVMLSGPARGSAAGALVAYALKITQVNPLRWDLLFERFMTANQKDNGFPDIDHDVSDPMKLKDILIEDWGDNVVVPISNWNTLQLRSLIKDIGKFYGIPFTETNAVTSKMIFEATPKAKAAHGIKAGVYVPTFEEVMEYSDSLRDFLAKYPDIETHVTRLYGAVRSASRHAGGVVIAEELDEWMPLINSKGVRQTPWSEGMNVRHLEPMGFIKFDLLGLASLRMMEVAITHILKRHHKIKNPSFEQIKAFYDKNLHPDVIDFDNQEIYENIFHEGKWAGIFQFTENGAQSFCQRAKPRSIVDISAITSIYRPGPLSANVDKEYVSAKNDPDSIEYPNEFFKEDTEETYGFLVFQEQIAKIAHRIGEDLSLDEGNMLRKVLTKRGTGKNDKKEMLYQKFIAGATKKGILKSDAVEMWEKFEYFSGYGFNKSHAVSYSILSFQCAWLMNYYPAEWVAAFLDKEPEAKKEKAISIAKGQGFEIMKMNVNVSGAVWEISEDGKILIQPLTSIKGFGDKAMKEVMDHRPFNTIEEFLFHERMLYSKLNKKNLDVLCRSGALDTLQDDRFTGSKHFWSAVAVLRPRKPKDLVFNIESEEQRIDEDFSKEEKITNLVELTGQFPIDLVMPDSTIKRLMERDIPAIGDFDPEEDDVVWFIPRKLIRKKTARGKPYLIVECVDNTSSITKIKCWNFSTSSSLSINRPYVGRVDYDQQWGFSSRSAEKSFRLIG